MKKLMFTLLAVAVSAAMSAQNSNVTLRGMSNPDNSMSIYADVTGLGTFTIEVLFDETSNTTVNKRFISTMDGSGLVVTLNPDDPGKPVTAEFRYNWIQGDLYAQADDTFVYRIPVANKKATHVMKLSSYEPEISGPVIPGIKIWRFSMDKGDTVYAMRKGEIIKIKGFGPDADEDPVSSLGNFIYVEHTDGTIAEYSMLAANSLKVAVGDTVYPDTPLALAGASDYDNFGTYIALYHYVMNENELISRSFAVRRYIDPIFKTSKGDMRLTDGDTVKVKVTKKMLKKESPQRNSGRK